MGKDDVCRFEGEERIFFCKYLPHDADNLNAVFSK